MGYTIGEVTKKTGLSVHTLRYYERKASCLSKRKTVPAFEYIQTQICNGFP